MARKENYTLGIDIGSTTVKIAILDENNDVVFSDYERHFADIQETLSDLLGRAIYKLGGIYASPVITGSGGLSLAGHLKVPFVQEVIAVSTALQDYAPQTDVAIELGGEDAKIIYFEGGNVEQRMNGVCKKLPRALFDRRKMRGICKVRYPAAHQRGGVERRSGGFDLPGSGQPDNQRPCLRQADPGTCGVSRGAAPFPVGT